MAEPVIVDAIRTPIGALGGVLAPVRPDDLAAVVIRAIVARNSLDPSIVEEVYFGCANQAGEDNRNVARMASLLAGLPEEVAGITINRLCASGLNAVNQAARAIRAGEGDVYIAGGVESMSRAPYSLPKGQSAYSFGNLTAWDTALGWRYPNPALKRQYGTESMGETAENIAAERPHLTREKQNRMHSLCARINGQSPPSTTASSRRKSLQWRFPREKGRPCRSPQTNAPAGTQAWRHWHA